MINRDKLLAENKMTKLSNKETIKHFLTIFFFFAAFAYIEAAVVVYLRAIFYEDGFNFPITTFNNSPLFGKLLVLEIFREAATLVILFAGSLLIEKDSRRRMAVFLIIFAVWDIFYYVWLKVLLGWPASVFDWDIIFLIPLTWAGPVLAPLISSFTMLVMAAILLSKISIKVTPAKAIAFVLTVIMIIATFCRAGLHIGRADYNDYFSWSIFIICHVLLLMTLYSCKTKSRDHDF